MYIFSDITEGDRKKSCPVLKKVFLYSQKNGKIQVSLVKCRKITDRIDEFWENASCKIPEFII